MRSGALIGPYAIGAEVGRGGMGVVFRARDVALDRPVAVKVHTPTLTADSDARARFGREMSLAARVEHPAIVPVYAVGVLNGVSYIAMRLLEGPSLAALLGAEGALVPERAMRRFAELAGALACLLHAMLTGGPPINAASPAEVIEAHRGEPRVASDVSAGVGGTLRRAMSADPAARFTDVGAFALAIEDEWTEDVP